MYVCACAHVFVCGFVVHVIMHACVFAYICVCVHACMCVGSELQHHKRRSQGLGK